MKIALIGYGKMGREIEKIALDRKHEIALKIDIDNLHEFTKENLQKCDVAIEFTIPETAYNNFLKCLEAGIPLVAGTTGWLDKYEEVIKYVKTNGKTFFYASNYSLGVNIFFNLNIHLAKIMNKFADYEVSMEELHHIHKKDAPSGTAISLANDLLENLDRKSEWKLDEPSTGKMVGIKAVREDEIPGTHIIKYHTDIDDIEIQHVAHNRKGFALGAVLAAEFIKDKTGVFSMKDLLGL
ncbi:MAG: 4-hydroxy-tetrahydrodipicolinate reductase [Bacteroidales bacterium]|nr:4-hydroxy-tetrahydrodipicolinate reductase [Bacteroidales bacterium]